MEDYNAVLEGLLQEERELQFAEFSHQTVYQIGSQIINKAMLEDKSIVVTIIRNGQQLFHCKLEGTSSDNDLWIKRKNNVVHHFNHSSYYIHVLLKSKNATIESSFLEPKDYAAEGGAFPVIIKGVGMIGTISVSGLPGEEDHRLITSVLKKFLNT